MTEQNFLTIPYSFFNQPQEGWVLWHNKWWEITDDGKLVFLTYNKGFGVTPQCNNEKSILERYSRTRYTIKTKIQKIEEVYLPPLGDPVWNDLWRDQFGSAV